MTFLWLLSRSILSKGCFGKLESKCRKRTKKPLKIVATWQPDATTNGGEYEPIARHPTYDHRTARGGVGSPKLQNWVLSPFHRVHRNLKQLLGNRLLREDYLYNVKGLILACRLRWTYHGVYEHLVWMAVTPFHVFRSQWTLQGLHRFPALVNYFEHGFVNFWIGLIKVSPWQGYI